MSRKTAHAHPRASVMFVTLPLFSLLRVSGNRRIVSYNVVYRILGICFVSLMAIALRIIGAT